MTTGSDPDKVLLDAHGSPASIEPDWEHKCENCGATPIVPFTGLCGPCTFGDADTIGGNW